jgi:carbon-monoxide dehydrogenase small subunit
VITEMKPTTHQIAVTVNGAAHSLEVEPRLLLVHLLREKLGLTGTHVGCDTTSCGACTVLVDGVPIKSGEPETFSGHETVEGVMEEIEEKKQS